MRRIRSKTHSAAHQPRPARRVFEEAPGATAGKLPEIAVCRRCGSSYRGGRWTWEKAPAGAHETRCPACTRIEGGYPAGVVYLAGAFAAAHRDELVGLLRNVEERERAEHPLKRIISIEHEAGGLTVETTDDKLAQSLGRALRKAYGGQLEHPGTGDGDENLVRVHWARD